MACMVLPVFGQDFPYSVPQAPEFDERGGSRSFDVAPRPDAAPRSRSRQQPEQEQVDYRSVRPYVPQESAPIPQQPYQENGVRAPRINPAPVNPYEASQQVRHVPQQPAPMRPPANVRQPQPQQEQRPDCSMYPMMIAQSKSESEMQMIARQYLTCLMKTGWNQDQAKQHVISTIESTFRLTR
jgi:hypothetical protein